MDKDLEKKVNDTINHLKTISNADLDFSIVDPIVKMMLVSLLYETQKIYDYVDGVYDRILERYCDTFIPRREVDAMPALTIVELRLKSVKNPEQISIGSSASFTYKLGDNKQQINYIPIFNTLCIPYEDLYIITPWKFYNKDKVVNISDDFKKAQCDGNAGRMSNSLWFGINSNVEINSLKGLSFLLNGLDVSPEHTYIYASGRYYDLECSDMRQMEDVEFLEPFDAQQSSSQFFSVVENWKDVLLNMQKNILLYVTADIEDRDVFKMGRYPEILQKFIKEPDLNSISNNTLWLKFDFPIDYKIPCDISISINVLPVANVDISSVTLTQMSPIAKLQKQDNSFFLNIIQTSVADNKQGFDMIGDDIIVRDFDAARYHHGDLYRDVRTLYNHFLDDYYAFIEYHGIKDGSKIRQLRDLINEIGTSVGNSNSKYSFDSGTFVMKNMNQSSHVKVSFSTTMGKLGNKPHEGDVMESKKLPAVEKDAIVRIDAMGGTDKASADEKYENLKYYSLTNDRLFTKKDIEVFLRKELIMEFGKSEFKRISVNLSVEGAQGKTELQRGLYITVLFKDKKNYDKAIESSFKNRIHQKILNRSCISMPIVIRLLSAESF